ncbi:hypothetical protein EI94DRAFT_1759811, partial [Lactarius quietus]
MVVSMPGTVQRMAIIMVEKDSRYSRWQPSLYSLLHTMYPGQMPTVRRNIFNVVLVL